VQSVPFGKLNFDVSRVGLGTWVTGGFLWGGVKDAESESAIETAIRSGITLIDTAPVYGFGHSEKMVGKIISRLGLRQQVILATKCGLEWTGTDARAGIRRNASRKRILSEIEESRERLQTDVIDIYQVHWPDEGIPFGETMETLHNLWEKGTIRAIGLSNFNVEQIRECLKYGPVHSLQPPYNLYERAIEKEILPFCRDHGIAVLAYGSICRGLLSGKMTAQSTYGDDDVRSFDPRFKSENLPSYVKATNRLKEIALSRGLTVTQLAIQWAATREGITSALVGARTAGHARDNAGAFNASLTPENIESIEKIIREEIPEPIERYYIAPPRNVPAKN